MNQTYNIIKNESALIDFIEWLPELNEGETYFLTLFARKKWFEMPIKGDKAQLKRFYSDKKYLLRKLKQLEIGLGNYKFDDYGVPNEALGVYISVNPRSLKKAMRDVTNELIAKGFDGNVVNPVDISLTAIQRNPSKRRYAIYDFDGVDHTETIKLIKDLDIVNLEALSIIKTRGGFHLLMDYNKIDDKHKNAPSKMLDLDGVDKNASGDCLTPLVGCTQGNFTPYLIKDVSILLSGKVLSDALNKNSKLCLIACDENTIKNGGCECNNSKKNSKNTSSDSPFGNFIGLTLKEADEIMENGFTRRVTRIDHEIFMLTQDLNFKRWNFEIEKGLITNAYIG